MPRPPEDRAVRLLLVGMGLDRGWNAPRAGADPAGGVARSLRAITGAPCRIDTVPKGEPATLLERLAADGSAMHHGAIVAIGTADAQRLTPVADWGGRLVALVQAVQCSLPAGAPVLLVGVPTVHIPRRVQALHPIALRHAARLDRVARRLAGIRAGVRYIAAPPLVSHVGRRPGNDLAAALDMTIASAVASALREQAAAVPPAPADRLDLRMLVDLARTDGLAALESLVGRAAKEFSVAEAAVSLFDGERRWRISSSRRGAVDAGRSLAYCETVACTDEQLVVEHSAREALAASARVGADVPAFYAGAPVHARDGTAVGAMCLLEAVPRSAGTVDVERLREFAHEVDVVLRALTAPAGDASARG